MMFKIISSNSSDNELRAYSKPETKEAKTKGREKERVYTVDDILKSLNKHQEGSLNSRLQHVITGILIEEKETRSLDITPYNDFEYDYITSHSLKELPYPNYIISACIFWRNINLNDSVDHLFDWKNIGEAYTVPFFNSITSSICYLEVQNKEIIRQEPNPKDLCGLDEDEACQLFEQLFEMIIFMSGFDAKNSDGDPYDFSKYIREKNRRIIIAVAKPIYGSINKRTNNLQIGEFVIGLGIVDNDQSVDENGNKRFQISLI